MLKHTYTTNRNVTNIIRFNNALTGEHVPAFDVAIDCKGSTYIYRGSARAFALHIAGLNREHGSGYATPVNR